MMNRLIDSLSRRNAKIRRKTHGSRLFRLLGGRGAATLAVGAVLSIGGITDALEGTHFLVRKDLDHVQVVRQKGTRDNVVATLDNGFAGNSVFKLSRVLPGSLVSQRVSLFDEAWLPEDAANAELDANATPLQKELHRFNVAIRRQFFADAVPFGGLIHEKAEKYKVDPALVAAVVETESRFRTNARSQVGAKGLMQLMPRTGRWMGARNLYDPEQNVDAGVKYLSYLSDRFDGNLKKTIAAYNGGEGNVKRYNGVPPFRETQQYVKKVMHKYEKRKGEMKRFEAEQRGGGVIAPPDAEVVAVR
ncbi:MAG: transglycosylase domain protein [Acidobacteria bacterium]|nr:transglycosylase domain protein [Acidobacteriota bacterium]